MPQRTQVSRPMVHRTQACMWARLQVLASTLAAPAPDRQAQKIRHDAFSASMQYRLSTSRAQTCSAMVAAQHPLNHRPPFSNGIFDNIAAGMITEWALDSYFRHYNLYQYACTAR